MLYTKKVDFHSHILTPSYYAYLDKYEGPEPDHFATPKWTEEGHMKLMDSLGVAYSSLSVSSPHPIQATAAERLSYVTNMNAEALDVVSRHPNRLGLFASLPLPDVDAACKMAEEMLSKEGVDGIGMLTNYNGIYLGSDKLDPLMEVLNAKSAVVDVHPCMPAALPGDAVKDMPIPIMDFLMDTTRAFTNMVWEDKFIQYPNITWIWPHGASFMTILSDRFASFAMQAKKNGSKRKMDYFGAMKNCYFDTAGFSTPKQIHDMKIDIPTDHFLYGSDCPYTPSFACIALAGCLEKSKDLSAKEKEMMFTTNAYAVNPKLKDILEPTEKARLNRAKRSTLGTAMNAFSNHNHQK